MERRSVPFSAGILVGRSSDWSDIQKWIREVTRRLTAPGAGAWGLGTLCSNAAGIGEPPPLTNARGVLTSNVTRRSAW